MTTPNPPPNDMGKSNPSNNTQAATPNQTNAAPSDHNPNNKNSNNDQPKTNPNPNKYPIGFAPIPMAIAVAITLLIWFVVPAPTGVKPEAWHLLALFVGTIAAIIGKAMPLGALSIIAIALVAITGVTNDKPADALKDALSSFSNPLIWLIGIAVMISYGLTKTGLGAVAVINMPEVIGLAL